MPRPRAQVHSNSTYTAIVSSHSGYTRLAPNQGHGCARPADHPRGCPLHPLRPLHPVRPLHPLTGARGLLTILEAALRPYNFELPSHAVRSLEVDAQMIREPQAQLERLLERLELGTKE